MDVIIADLNSPKERTDFLTLFTEYTTGMLPSEPQGPPENLVAEIIKRPNVLIFLAYKGDEPAGFSLVIEAFSSFRAMPILNIHDIGVGASYRRMGVGKALLAHVQREAERRGCCKLTLEVDEQNTRALTLYESMGYSALTGEKPGERRFFMTHTIKTDV